MKRKKRNFKKLFLRKFGLVLAMSFISFGVSYPKVESKAQQPKIFVNMDRETYIVKEGDSVELIASKYAKGRKLSNVVAEIQYLNNVNEIIYPNQKLIIPIERKN